MLIEELTELGSVMVQCMDMRAYELIAVSQNCATSWLLRLAVLSPNCSNQALKDLIDVLVFLC